MVPFYKTTARMNLRRENNLQEIRHFSPLRLRSLCHTIHEPFTSKTGNRYLRFMRFAALMESCVCKEEIQVGCHPKILPSETDKFTETVSFQE